MPEKRRCSFCYNLFPDTVEYFPHKGNRCSACVKERDHLYREANRDKRRASDRRWYASNKEKKRIYHNDWRKANPEKERAKWHRRYLANPEHFAEKSRRRHIRIRAGETDVTGTKIRDLKKKSRGICYWCHKKMKPHEMSVDHVKPLAKGGPHLMYNLVICHRRCNSSKSDKEPQEMGVLL